MYDYNRINYIGYIICKYYWEEYGNLNILYSVPLIVLLMIAVILLLADRKRHRREEYASSHDELTGFYNREGFFEKAGEVLRKTPKKKMCIVCTNIKNFKLTNDLFGNEMGDRVLYDLAATLKLPNSDDCVQGRIAGDKFAMLIARDKLKIDTIAEKASKIQYNINDTNYKLHVAVGVYEVEDNTESVQIMCDKANMAIESLQEDYGKIIAYYDNKMLDSLISEKTILSDFDEALSKKQFKMYLQPQVSNKGVLIGAEAMVRWHHPTLGILMPVEFIGIIEKRGFIYRLDKEMWEMAAQKLGDWNRCGINNLSISVNVSTKDFYYADLYKVFTGLVQKYDIPPNRLNIEITETVFMGDVDEHMETIKKLKEYGFCIEIDDFGSGYSSLNMLKDIEADIIKIDMAFLEETDNLVNSRIIIKSVISMAKELGKTVITEGVSTTEHVEFLTEMGCDIFQGYYYSMPIAVEEFEEKYKLGN